MWPLSRIFKIDEQTSMKSIDFSRLTFFRLPTFLEITMAPRGVRPQFVSQYLLSRPIPSFNRFEGNKSITAFPDLVKQINDLTCHPLIKTCEFGALCSSSVDQPIDWKVSRCSSRKGSNWNQT